VVADVEEAAGAREDWWPNFAVNYHLVKSGKHTKNYGKYPFSKSTINGNFQ